MVNVITVIEAVHTLQGSILSQVFWMEMTREIVNTSECLLFIIIIQDYNKL